MGDLTRIYMIYLIETSTNNPSILQISEIVVL